MRRIAIASFVLAGGACGVEKVGGGEGGGACVPAPVQAVFDARCANQPGCHGVAPTTQVSIDLRAGGSSAIVGQTAVQNPSLPLVEIGNVEGSYLVQKMSAMPPSGLRMPQSADFTDPQLQADIALIIGWVGGAEFTACAGATDSGSDTTAVTTAATTDSGSTGEPVPLLCGIEDLDPGAPNPIVSGDMAGQIPTEIGEILANNCGCHFTDNTPFTHNVTDYEGMAKLSTLDEWLGPNYAGSPTTTIAVSKAYVEKDGVGGMPPVLGQCDIGDGSGKGMPPDERATLLSWINAGGPDGASWPP